MCGALAFLLAALLAPMAIGAVRPDDREGQLGTGAVVTAQVVRPDDQAGLLGPGAVSPVVTALVVRPDDRAGPLGTGAVALEGKPTYWQGERDFGAYTSGGDIVAPTLVPGVEVPSGWEWNDAWFGVMMAVGLALVAAVIMVTVHEHRGHHPLAH
jgi:hypothetical protein